MAVVYCLSKWFCPTGIKFLESESRFKRLRLRITYPHFGREGWPLAVGGSPSEPFRFILSRAYKTSPKFFNLQINDAVIRRKVYIKTGFNLQQKNLRTLLHVDDQTF